MDFSSRYYKNQGIRVLEKIPGVNLVHYLPLGGQKLFMTPKCGSRTIRDLFMRVNGLSNRAQVWNYLTYMSASDLKDAKSEDMVVIVRDPFERLESCWRQKIKARDPKSVFYFFQYYPLIRPAMSFAEFLWAVSKIPVHFCEKHFIPISFYFKPEDPINFVSIDNLNKKLYKLSEKFDGEKSNYSQRRGPILDQEKSFFDQHLKDRYALDQELLRIAKKRC